MPVLRSWLKLSVLICVLRGLQFREVFLTSQHLAVAMVRPLQAQPCVCHTLYGQFECPHPAAACWHVILGAAKAPEAAAKLQNGRAGLTHALLAHCIVRGLWRLPRGNEGMVIVTDVVLCRSLRREGICSIL